MPLSLLFQLSMSWCRHLCHDVINRTPPPNSPQTHPCSDNWSRPSKTFLPSRIPSAKTTYPLLARSNSPMLSWVQSNKAHHLSTVARCPLRDGRGTCLPQLLVWHPDWKITMVQNSRKSGAM
ncbi:hypothetical protein LZ30DRAFT_733833 [Colletotrichum cereale]|nr:hypothetical protein LZ30DRAFT_733833 [Colletotrichum cereale]